MSRVRFPSPAPASAESTPSWPGLSPQVGFTRLAITQYRGARVGPSSDAVHIFGWGTKGVDARAEHRHNGRTIGSMETHRSSDRRIAAQLESRPSYLRARRRMIWLNIGSSTFSAAC